MIQSCSLIWRAMSTYIWDGTQGWCVEIICLVSSLVATRDLQALADNKRADVLDLFWAMKVGD